MAPPRQSIQELLDRYVTLWEQADIPGFVALLREDAWFTMPPLPVWFQGRAAIAMMFQTHLHSWQATVPAANARQWVSGFRTLSAGGRGRGLRLFGLMVLSVEGEQIASLVAFLDVASLASFALPPTLPSSLGIDAYPAESQEITISSVTLFRCDLYTRVHVLLNRNYSDV